MSSAEESVLLSLLPLFQKKLDVKFLQPFLKQYCSFSNSECELVCGPSAELQRDSASLMLVELLRRKNSQYCGQMLLMALQQSITRPGKHVWGHNEVIRVLQMKLGSSEVPSGINKAWAAIEGDSVSACSTQDNSSINYFPSATLVHSSLYDSGTSGHAFNGSGDHSHNGLDEVSPMMNGAGGHVEVLLTIGASGDPAPTVEFKSRFSRCIPSELAQKLIIESRNIQACFSNFVLEVCSLLESSSTVYIEKLQMWLSFQNCTGVVHALKAFDSTSQVLCASSVPSLISALRSYSSWYNYDLIADIAKRFCSSEGERAVNEYESLLREYMQRVIVHCPQPSLKSDGESDNLELLRMEIDGDFSSTTLQDLAIFKQTLCKVCDLDPRFVVLKKIDISNYQLVWAVPKVTAPAAVGALRTKWAALEEKNVKCVSLCGQDVSGEKVEKEKTSSAEVKRSVSPSLSSIFDEIFTATTTSITNDLESLQTLANGTNYGKSHEQSKQEEKASNGWLGEVAAPPLLRSTSSGNKAHYKTQPLGRSAQSEASTSSLLSEISESLKCPDLLSCADDSAISVSHPKAVPIRPGVSPIVTRVKSMLVPSASIVQNARYSLNLNDQFNSSPSPDFLKKKSVSFLWRILGRASPDCCANIFINPIYDVAKETEDDVSVRKGQLLKALYRIDERIFVETLTQERGFVPYSSSRIAKKYYGSKSRIIQLSYLQLHVQSPDGLDVQPPELVPTIQMTTLRDHLPSSKEELSLKADDVITCLYSDADVIYGTTGQCSGIVPQESCELQKKLKPYFKTWRVSNSQAFYSDFVIRRSDVRPAVLDENPITKAEVENRNCSSRIGKMFTITQNFVPDLPVSSNFTIRKGLRVKVLDENQKHACVSTKTGSSFWIPFTHLRPARKNSDAEYFFQSPLL